MSTPRRALGNHSGRFTRTTTGPSDPDTDKPAIPMLRVARAPRGVARSYKYVDLKITTAYVQNRPSREKRTELPRDRRVFATTRCATGGRVAAPHTSVHDDRLYIRSVHLDMCQGVSARGEGHASVPRRDVASRECRCKAPGRPRCTRASWTCVFVRGNEPFRTALARVACARVVRRRSVTREMYSAVPSCTVSAICRLLSANVPRQAHPKLEHDLRQLRPARMLQRGLSDAAL